MLVLKASYIIFVSILLLSVAAMDDACTADCSCMGTFKMPGTNFGFSYYANKPITEKNEKVNKVVLLLHGLLRNGNTYYTLLKNGSLIVDAENYIEDETVMISPRFFNEEDFSWKCLTPKIGSEEGITDFLYFYKGGWMRGEGALNQGAEEIYSFDVLDQIAKLSVMNFPNLKEIKYAGHSGGAQALQRYAALTKLTKNDLSSAHLSFYIGSPGTLLYFDDRRMKEEAFNECGPGGKGCPTSPDDFQQGYYDSASCPGYNDWAYGFNDLKGYAKANYQGADKAVEKYISQDVVFVSATKDTSRSSHEKCEWLAQGLSRYHRVEAFKKYMEFFYNKDVTIEEIDCTHQPECMFTNPDNEGANILFKWSPTIDEDKSKDNSGSNVDEDKSKDNSGSNVDEDKSKDNVDDSQSNIDDAKSSSNSLANVSIMSLIISFTFLAIGC